MPKLHDCRTFMLSLASLLSLSLGSIAQKTSASSQNITEEIRKVEKQFETDLNQFGAAMAFEKYAAEDAVIRRHNDSLIYGPKASKEFYSAENFKNAKATWSPDYIDSSVDGTLAYTYGKYQWTTTTSSGQTQNAHGIFHTVWKRQKDGTWKYVWD